MNDARMRSIARILAAARAQDTDAETFEVEAEDELPYVQLGHWIGLADIKHPSARLYWFLAMHLNYKRGDRYVWPSTEILAVLLGYSRGDKIAPYVQDLERIGALKVIKVPNGTGPEKRNVYKLRRTPPDDYAGPRSLSEFYDRLGRAYDEAVLEGIDAANSNDTAGQTVSPQTGEDAPPRLGGDVGPPFGGHVGPQLRGVTTRSSNKKKENGPAPSARSAPDARRATTGSSAREAGGSAAFGGAKAPKRASKQVRMTKVQAEGVRTVEAGFPAELRSMLPGYRPAVLRDAILEGLEQRTAEQLADRVDRRWFTWGFAAKAEKGSLDRPVGVVVSLLRAGECPDLRCEDGTQIDTGQPCVRCVERKQDRKAAPRKRQEAPAAPGCPGCGAETGGSGQWCEECPVVIASARREVEQIIDQAVIDWTNRGTDDLELRNPLEIQETAAEIRATLDQRIEAARQLAAQDGATALGQALAARLAADQHAQYLRRKAVAAEHLRLAAGHPVASPSAVIPPQASPEAPPCPGHDGQGCPADGPAVGNGLCTRCRIVALRQSG